MDRFNHQMPMKTLGKGGPIVSQMALGTMTFGAETDQEEAFAQLDCFYEFGGNFIDTADVYNDGNSEALIGEWCQSRGIKDEMIIATKCRFAPPKGSHGASRRGIVKALDASLKRLQTERIDLYFIHGWDQNVDIRETLSTLKDLMSAGKICNFGWSNLSGWQLQNVISTCDAMQMARPVVIQSQYNLLDRGIEIELMPCALENGISITPWSPLGGGWLTGKYRKDQRPQGETRLGEDPSRGVEAYDNRNTSRTHKILEALEEIAISHNRPMPHIALAWLAGRPNADAILLGARTKSQLVDNLGASGFELSEEEQDILTKVSAPNLPQYPYQFLEDWSQLSIWKELGT